MVVFSNILHSKISESLSSDNKNPDVPKRSFLCPADFQVPSTWAYYFFLHNPTSIVRDLVKNLLLSLVVHWTVIEATGISLKMHFLVCLMLVRFYVLLTQSNRLYIAVVCDILNFSLKYK